jgi:hypothetical protein
MDITVSEIKNNLHRLIVETDDISVLEKVQEYFGSLKSKQVDWWDALSANEMASVEKGLKQLDNGQRIPHHQVKQKVKNLLENK